jgi:anti-sigma regulatory factor (Ser/Thr protein kinase)
MVSPQWHSVAPGIDGPTWVAGIPRLSTTVQAVRPHSTYRHEAFLYAGEDDFLRGTVPFVQDGVAAGQPVMVAVVPDRLELLRSAVGSECADRVRWVDMARLGENPGRIIPAWLDFVTQHGAGRQPVRGVGEPVWAGRRPSEVTECQLHEALLNLAVEPETALWLRCPYDVTALDADVLQEAARSHPVLVDGEHYRGSTLYGGSAHAVDVFETPLPEPDGEVQQWRFTRGEGGHPPESSRDTARLRQTVLRRAAEAGLPEERGFDMALAATEAMTNSLRHGGGSGVLRMWQDAEGLTCEVRDRGHIGDPMAGRRLSPPTDPGGRGLWLVHQLSDLVQIRSAEQEGSTVRITNWLRAG